MPILFFTNNLDEIRYQRVIRRCLWEIYKHDVSKVLKFLDLVTIKIHSNEDTNVQYFQHIKTTSGQKINPKITSGHAGKYEVTLFLHDTSLTSLGFRFRENVDRIGHELDHEVLWLEEFPDHVTPVHQRNNTHGKFTFWFWTLKPFVKIPCTIIDVRDLI